MIAAMKTRLLVLAPAAMLLASIGLAQQMYRWVDKDGKVHYTQQPPPSGAASSVESRRATAPGAGTPQLPFALAQAMKNFPVVVYVAPECKEGCPELRELLTRRGVPYREVNVADLKAHEQLKKATGDTKVPAMTVGSLVQKGFEPDAVNNVLDTAGYPRTPSFTGKPPALPEPADKDAKAAAKDAKPAARDARR